MTFSNDLYYNKIETNTKKNIMMKYLRKNIWKFSGKEKRSKKHGMQK